MNVQATNVAPTECPDEAADEFAFTGSADCADRNATVRVAIDESWYDCSSKAATTIWLWVHVAANGKVRGAHTCANMLAPVFTACLAALFMTCVRGQLAA